MSMKSKKDADPVKNRIGVFYKNWMESAQLAHGMTNCYLTSYKNGQIVSNEVNIDRLVSLNAPMRVYVEYVDG